MELRTLCASQRCELRTLYARKFEPKNLTPVADVPREAGHYRQGALPLRSHWVPSGLEQSDTAIAHTPVSRTQLSAAFCELNATAVLG